MEFREIDTLYNIMVINMAYIEIEKFKSDKIKPLSLKKKKSSK